MPHISRDSLLSLEQYHRQRDTLRTEAIECKNQRRIYLGDHVTLAFENEVTLRYQIQEMLRIEKTFDDEGIEDELEAYNPLIPDGTNWKATMMIEYVDADERAQRLMELKGVENHLYVQIAGCDRIYAIADEDLERANETKTSAVHFVRFELDPGSINAVKAGQSIAMGIDHAAYNVRVDEISPEAQGSLTQDLA
ncbi:DUF3501 family protein [Litorivicinus lipolyticus]|uniref:DUF3501 family protein n=1 Tax=Litorivicinus lipolyticus TaxID=418701 RepID=A0A5Q2QCY1_9GAMM|nr:DUF3501 family protein [Litorivicinus lipolyticus]QGG80201.1 DUF3501 family protein [Litorivicinus lipolyticus]